MRPVFIQGKFEEITNGFKYFGEMKDVEKEPFLSIGRVKFDQYFAGGEITLTANFQKISHRNMMGIVLYNDPISDDMLIAGFGAYTMVTIRSWANNQWKPLSEKGDKENIKPGIDYHLKVSLRGSLINVYVNNVHVASHNYTSIVPRSQIGLFIMEDAELTIKNLNIATERPKVFAIMQFTKPYDEIYHAVIKSVCNEFGIDVKRADESFTTGPIINDIANQIFDSKFIIADISPVNANVFYELGFAHAVNKPTILLAEKETRLPFDVSQYRTILYENTIPGKEKFEETLRNHVRGLLGIT